MTAYFDSAEQGDRKLLPSGLRSNSELAITAIEAEADIIAHFTEGPPYLNYTNRLSLLTDGVVPTEVVGEDVSAGPTAPQLAVYLRGFKADASQADANLRAALKRTIAEVIAWRLRKIEPGVASSSDQVGKSRTFRPDADDRFPRGWDRWLRPFKSEEPCWGL